MANYTLANLDKWATKTEARMLACVQAAALSLIEEVQKPTAKGGRTPVDTGFLRNSLSAAINSNPRGLSAQPAGYAGSDYDFSNVALIISRLSIGDRLVLGYTAGYAPYMEARYGFVRLAAQNWPSHVTAAVKQVKQEVKR